MMEEEKLTLTGSDKSNLLEVAKWGRFLSIVGFIMSGFIVLIGLFMVGGGMQEFYPGIGIVYILMSLLYVFPSLYLFRFSNQIRQGVQLRNQNLCSKAYNNLRRLFLFMGIMTIVVLALYALAILFAIMGGVIGSML